ncbi:MAG: penicillin-binding protein 2, partial [Spirochaetota bacterium]|nr:penicillin-binding protein 2 [Spirochaetota bacterium]
IAHRGLILDRNGEKLVDNKPSYSLYITPALFPKEEPRRTRMLNYLSKKLNIPFKSLQEDITIKNPLKQNKYSPIIIKRDLVASEYSGIKENKNFFPGVEVKVVSVRRYLINDNLSHVVGYTGIIDPKAHKYYKTVVYKDNQQKNPYKDGKVVIGKWGLEKYQDLILRGEDGIATCLKDSLGQPIEETIKVLKEPIPGKNIYLTIDKRLQDLAKTLMKDKIGAIIVSKPSTGEILALVSNPSFNPNILVSREKRAIHEIDNDPNKPYVNRAIRGRYSPSSLFKIVVALAALEENISYKKEFTCTGAVGVGDRFFKCHNIHGTLNMVEALEKSCNAYFYQLAEEVTWKNIYKYAKMFGLGTQLRLETGKSIDGILPNNSWKIKMFNEVWFPGDTLNHAIGQGYTILPPIQIHNIISAIANDGVIYKPYLIKKQIDPINQKEIITNPVILRTLQVKNENLMIVNKALRGVVLEGTATLAKVSEKYPIAGKTGTAQDPKGSPHAWFSCYAPYHSKDPNERIAVTVLVENTEGGGGFIASPIATALIKYYFENTPVEDIQKQMGTLIVSVDQNKISEELTQTIKPILEDETTLEDKRIKAETEILQKLKEKHSKLAWIPPKKAKPIKKEPKKQISKVAINLAKDRLKKEQLAKKQLQLAKEQQAKEQLLLAKELQAKERLEKIQLEKIHKIQLEKKRKEHEFKLAQAKIKKENEIRERERLRKLKEQQDRYRREQEKLRLARLRKQKEIEIAIRNQKRSKKPGKKAGKLVTSETEENKRFRDLIADEEKRLKKGSETELDE